MNERRRPKAPLPTDTAEGLPHEFIAFGPIDETRPRIDAVVSNLTRALLGELPMVPTVESSIVALEQCTRYLRLVA